MADHIPFTNAAGAPVADNTNILTAGPRGPALLQDVGSWRNWRISTVR
jgi:catalase